MRGRRILSIFVVIMILCATLYITTPPVNAYTTNVGVRSIGASHEFPRRVEESPENIVVSAYNDGWEGGNTTATFNVTVYYYNQLTPSMKYKIGQIKFILSTLVRAPPQPSDVHSNETAKAVQPAWDFSALAEGSYKFYANITSGLPMGDENAADNQVSSDANANWRQRQFGVIQTGGSNVGISAVTGEITTGIRVGTRYAVSISAFNNGYTDKSFTVTAYYNATAFNTTTITNLPAKTGSKQWVVMWDTTGLSEGRYNISAYASPVSGEIIVFEQRDYIRQLVPVIQHDIAVLDVIGSPTGVTAGQPVKVNATVKNEGAAADWANVTAYVNDVAIPGEQKVYLLPLDDSYRILDRVSPSATWSPMRDWTSSFVNVPLGNYSWDNMLEPNNGAWDWTDVQNIIIKFESNVTGSAEERVIKIYEIWAVVTTDAASYTRRPTANTITGISVTNPANAYDSSFSSYASFKTDADGSIEFKTFSPSGSGTINRVDFKIMYSALHVAKNLTFTWDTTGKPNGSYQLNATAKLVPGETIEIIDNSRTYTDARRKVNIPPKHDVATVLAYVNVTYAKPGDPVLIGAQAEDQGDSDESFSVTPYYGGTQAAPSKNVVLTKRSNTGQEYDQTEEHELEFVWDTTGVALGSYTIKVAAQVVIGETEISNNNYTVPSKVIFTKVYIVPFRTINDVSSQYLSRPSAWGSSSANLKVKNPTYAYDVNNNTAASYLLNATGNLDYYTFSTPPSPTTEVARVDLKARYKSDSVPTDRYCINRTVDPSTSWVSLTEWTPKGLAIYSDKTWTLTEPNDGTWSFTDVRNIRVRFGSDHQTGAETMTIYVYEITAKVTNMSGSYYFRPTTHSITGITVTDAAKAYNGIMTDYAYYATTVDGYIDFLTFNTTASNTGSITKVELTIRIRPAGVADDFDVACKLGSGGAYKRISGLDVFFTDTAIPLATYTWPQVLDPGNGKWSWTDVQNLRLGFRNTNRGLTTGARNVTIHEIWAIIYDKPFNVTYNVGGIDGLRSWSVRISWNTSVLDFISASTGRFFQTNGHPDLGAPNPMTSYWTEPKVNRTAGYVDLLETATSAGTANGTGTLAHLTFVVLRAGKSPFALSETGLVDSWGINLGHYAEDGKFNTIPLYGDMDGDGDVDAAEIARFSLAYGSRGPPSPSPNWDAACDFNGDLIVDAKDLRILGKSYW